MDLHPMLVVSFLFVIHPGEQQQCSIDSLPPLGDTTNDIPERGMFQAIVPAYTFQCTGRYRVTEWMACVDRNRRIDQYYIQFQVWRRNGLPGCYSLIGYNEPVESLVPNNVNNDPLEHCVVLTVEEDKQIEVQSGDVVGYYVDSNSDDDDKDDNGIQWNLEEDNEDSVVVYYEDSLPRESIKSHYGLDINPSECAFELPANADTNSYHLSLSTTAAPIISFSIVTIIPPSSSQPPVVLPPDPLPSPDTSTPFIESRVLLLPLIQTTNVISSPSIPFNFSQSSDSSGLITGIAFILLLAIVLYIIAVVIVFRVKRKRETPEPLIGSYKETLKNNNKALNEEIVSNTHLKEINTEAYHTNAATNASHVNTTVSTVTVPQQTDPTSMKPSTVDKETSTYGESYEEISLSIRENLNKSSNAQQQSSTVNDDNGSGNVSYYEGGSSCSSVSDVPSYAYAATTDISDLGNDTSNRNKGADISNLATNVRKSDNLIETSTNEELGHGICTSQNPSYLFSPDTEYDKGFGISISQNPAYSATSVPDHPEGSTAKGNDTLTTGEYEALENSTMGGYENSPTGRHKNSTTGGYKNSTTGGCETTRGYENSTTSGYETLENSITAEYEALENSITGGYETLENSTTVEYEALDDSTNLKYYYCSENTSNNGTVIPAKVATAVTALATDTSTNVEYYEGDAISVANNPSYKVSRSDALKDDTSTTAEYYEGGHISISQNPSYSATSVPESNTMEDETSSNAEYIEGSVSISSNPSYNTTTSVPESDSVNTSPNVAYNSKGTDITTANNPAYIPTEDSSENTLEYDYI